MNKTLAIFLSSSIVGFGQIIPQPSGGGGSGSGSTVTNLTAGTGINISQNGNAATISQDTTVTTNIANNAVSTGTAALANGLTSGARTLGYVILSHSGTNSYYPSLESAGSNMVAGDLLTEYGLLDCKAPIFMPANSTIMIDGVVSNYVDLNALGPMIQPANGGNNITVGGGGVIYPGTDHSTVYHACFGPNISASSGIAYSSTNFTVENLSMYGDSDVIFILHTNYFSGRFDHCYISSLTNAAWDIVVAYNTNNIGYVNFDFCRFNMGPIVSSLGGASLRGVNTSGIKATYNNCIFTADSSIANNFCFKDSGALGTASNIFNNCLFFNYGATGSTASGCVVENNAGWDSFNNCYVYSDTGGGIRFIGASTNAFNNLTVSAPSFQLKLAPSAIVNYTLGNITNVATTPANYVAIPTVTFPMILATNSTLPTVIGNTGAFWVSNSASGPSFWWITTNHPNGTLISAP